MIKADKSGENRSAELLPRPITELETIRRGVTRRPADRSVEI